MLRRGHPKLKPCVLTKTARCTFVRFLSSSSRSTLSSIWAPTGLIVQTPDETGHDKLVRAGFLRQSLSGVFHMLPLGNRVQEKLESLIDEEMRAIGASKVSMSSITSEDLWRKSGRLDKVSAELFRLQDRKEVPLMLSPTHEEEITSLVAGTLKSYKDLPIKLYQISRKYRDEARPRQGLLRSREFIMKDLYTFDVSPEAAIESYHQVAGAYKAVFERLKLPVIVAEASSGDMGGSHSHEYHLPHTTGSDTVLTCNHCGYAANDEVASSRPRRLEGKAGTIRTWRGLSKDRKTLVKVWYRSASEDDSARQINIHGVKAIVPELDTAIIDAQNIKWMEESDAPSTQHVVNIVDSTLSGEEDWTVPDTGETSPDQNVHHTVLNKQEDGSPFNLLSIADGDGCARCETGSLKTHRALELGHTFYLGTRYSKPLGAKVTVPHSKAPTLLEMGCYGIGVSRIVAAVAEHMADASGLNWPRAIAPFEAVILPTSDSTDDVLRFHDELASWESSQRRIDVVLDDRKQSFGWKIRDAETTGYPVIIILGKRWKAEGLVEIQCRRLSVKETLPAHEAANFLQELLSRL